MDNIHVRMLEKGLFDTMFEKTIKYDFSKVKILKNGDLEGNISQTYFFSNGLLRRITIQSSTIGYLLNKLINHNMNTY